MLNTLLVSRTTTALAPNMAASWLITRDDGTVVLSIQAQGHPEALEQLESMLTERFTIDE